MRKIMLCLMAAFAFTLVSHAQDSKSAVKTTTSKTVYSKDGKTKVEKKTTLKAGDQKTTAKTSVVLKKDGTPDKRYKTSKMLKKDGTPDMRYTVNKKKSTTTTK